MSHGNEMICQQVTLSGYAEWPKVADAVIEALASIHVLIDVEQPFHSGFDVHKLPQVQNGRIHKVDLAADKPLVGTPFIVGGARRLHHRTGVNQVAESLKICFNPQTGWLAKRPLSPADALSSGIHRSTRQIPAFLLAHRFHSAGQTPPWTNHSGLRTLVAAVHRAGPRPPAGASRSAMPLPPAAVRGA